MTLPVPDERFADERVRELFHKKRVIHTHRGINHDFFVVINKYEEKYDVKIDNRTDVAMCSCKAVVYGNDCYHVKAARILLEAEHGNDLHRIKAL